MAKVFTMFKTFSKRLFNLIPSESALLYKIASRYVERFNSDNNSDFFTNGEAKLLRTALPEVSGGGVIFDVGANIGEWSLFCLSIAPEAEIHLFEPSAVTYQKLKHDLWPRKAHVNNFGLGERNEVLRLNIFDDGSGMNSLYPRHGIGEHKIIKTEEVQIRTIDDYCEECGIQQIDFMKVDVEGHELSVFKGASKMLSQKRISMIQFEYGGCNLDSRIYLRDIWDLLAKYGYKMAKIYPDRLHYYHDYDQQLETFKYSNWVAQSGK